MQAKKAQNNFSAQVSMQVNAEEMNHEVCVVLNKKQVLKIEFIYSTVFPKTYKMLLRDHIHYQWPIWNTN